ncbi:MAG TPA: DivIVA domain-containing protein [Actinomycetota bacterium]|nr:DivIVA domain-containing protein [Actinomycetota bacterium]
MELVPREIHDKQFHDEWRGYNREEVDDFLDRVADSLDQSQRSNQSLSERVRQLESQLAQAREGEQMLKKTLVTAQHHAEEAVAAARSKADKMVAEAGERGRAMLDEARSKASSIESEARRRAQETERVSEQRQRELESSIEKLRALEADTKQKLKAFLDGQQRSLTSLSERRTALGGATTARPQHGGSGQPPPQRQQPAPGATPPQQQSPPQQGQGQRGAGSAGPQHGGAGSAGPQAQQGAGTGPVSPERLTGADAAGPLLGQEQERETEPPAHEGEDEESAARRTLQSLFGRDEE